MSPCIRQSIHLGLEQCDSSLRPNSMKIIVTFEHVPIVHPMLKVGSNWSGTILCFVDGINPPDTPLPALIEISNAMNERPNLVIAHSPGRYSHCCIFSLLLSQSTTYGLAQHLWVYLGACSPTSDQWNMCMISGALLVKLLPDTSTAPEKSCGLFD